MLTDPDHDAYDPMARKMLRLGAVVIMVVPVVLALLVAQELGAGSPRAWLNLVVATCGAAAWALLRAGRAWWAALTLVTGYWASVSALTLLHGGLSAPQVLNYPLILVIAGWLLGVGPTLTFAVLTQAVFLGLFGLQVAGALGPRSAGSPLPLLIFVSAVTQFTAVATVLARRGYMDRLHEVRRAMAQLAQREAQISRQRDQLEEEVRQRTEELARARDVAEAANRAKSAFLANISHEIRTPLNAISGMAHLLRTDGLDATQTHRLDVLERAGGHLLGIVNSVLDLSKIEAGKFELARLPLQVDAVVGEVVAMLRDAAKAKGLRLETEVGEMPAGLVGDGLRLRQALLNYVGNAVKFTDRGRVLVRASCTEHDDTHATLHFEVQDSGAGIAPETLARLFGQFEQADSSTTRHHGGTGLGLAISQRLARLMGGDAGARSEPGVGSTFWLTVKLAIDPLAASVAPLPALAPGDALAALQRDHAGARVLLAEDDAVNREIAMLILQQAGLVVDTAEDGLQALARAEQVDYALIIMDMQMPRMGGVETTRRVRRLPGRAATPILAMTANAFDEDRVLCLEAGMSGFISKPAPADRLYAEVLACLSRR